jgi:hypothetical protein
MIEAQREAYYPELALKTGDDEEMGPHIRRIDGRVGEGSTQADAA